MIAIIDYRCGNLTSVQNALSHLEIPSIITHDREEILKANRVIFPGVGAARSAIQNIKNLKLDFILKDFLKTKKPLLGICIGAQVILSSSEEDNHTTCLDLVKGKSTLLKNSITDHIQIPHIGWNQIQFKTSHPLFKNIPNQSEFYFNHSYFVTLKNSSQILSTTQYGINDCTTVFQQNNLIACQFHPEKSSQWGLQFFKNFSSWNYISE